LPNFYVLDEREIWHRAACAAAEAHGYTARRIFHGSEVDTEGLGFIRPHADWRVLPKNKHDDALMRSKLTMIQDRQQVEVYENKRAQFERWGEWMPDTWVFTDHAAALEFVERADCPLVSKANEGASSVNVRILESREAARDHIELLWGAGITVNHGAGGKCPLTKQKGYALLQRFIPHKVTFRVNAIGDCRAVFFRYCYPDRAVAQTGNVDPAFEMTPEVESLLEYANRVFAAIGSKWCALDILKDGDEWKLLESSLAWPWPSPGRCNEGAIFGSGGKQWIDLFDVMFDEVQRGAFSPCHK
jgi:glutathione synthase/RimK-type ligase-like ATP-grasp enzyme